MHIIYQFKSNNENWKQQLTIGLASHLLTVLVKLSGLFDIIKAQTHLFSLDMGFHFACVMYKDA